MSNRVLPVADFKFRSVFRLDFILLKVGEELFDSYLFFRGTEFVSFFIDLLFLGRQGGCNWLFLLGSNLLLLLGRGTS